MKTAIVTDTNSGFTIEEGKSQNIYVLPMPVIIENNSYLESVDITHKQLYEAMRLNKAISSSQPSPGSVMELWDLVFEDGYDEIVYIPMSSGLSGSCQNAIQFALNYKGKVQVVDNHRISVTLKESVKDAQFMAAKGYSAAHIKARLEENAYNSSIYITVNSLEYLKKSGRVTPAGATLANVINLKPVLTIQGERLDSYAKVRGMKQAERKMIDALQNDLCKRFADIPSDHLLIGTAGTFESAKAAEEWYLSVKNAFPAYQSYYLPLSCSIACHVGIDAAGIGICVLDRQ
ncbi:MAG: DegV family protein [Bacillota bacterium]|nr:DegV family protein [Bacillota bacterium]